MQTFLRSCSKQFGRLLCFEKFAVGILTSPLWRLQRGGRVPPCASRQHAGPADDRAVPEMSLRADLAEKSDWRADRSIGSAMSQRRSGCISGLSVSVRLWRCRRSGRSGDDQMKQFCFKVRRGRECTRRRQQSAWRVANTRWMLTVTSNRGFAFVRR
jgi:hypothetical protein